MAGCLTGGGGSRSRRAGGCLTLGGRWRWFGLCGRWLGGDVAPRDISYHSGEGGFVLLSCDEHVGCRSGAELCADTNGGVRGVVHKCGSLSSLLLGLCH